jgi:uncharacterized OB-fold protein
MTSVVQQETGEKRLYGSRCSRCGYVSFPAMTVCPKCGPAYSKEVKPIELPSVGTVITWTKLQVAPKGFPSPLVHCIVDLGMVNIIGTVQGTSEIRSGEKMAIVKDPTGKFPFIFSRSLMETKPT